MNFQKPGYFSRMKGMKYFEVMLLTGSVIWLLALLLLLLFKLELKAPAHKMYVIYYLHMHWPKLISLGKGFINLNGL